MIQSMTNFQAAIVMIVVVNTEVENSPRIVIQSMREILKTIIEIEEIWNTRVKMKEKQKKQQTEILIRKFWPEVNFSFSEQKLHIWFIYLWFLVYRVKIQKMK